MQRDTYDRALAAEAHALNTVERWVMRRARLLWLAMALIPFLLAPATSRAGPVSQNIDIGVSLVRVTGPWKFHIGDDAAWARPDLNDGTWEQVDLTAPQGAHDEDVGFSDYVPGWSLRGHKDYSGYAWYRTRVTIQAAIGAELALAGPAAVDSAYQLYINGILAGGSGAFGGRTPTVFSILPRAFPLHLATGNSAAQTITIAIRVWLSPREVEGNDYGGVHIAPLIGTRDAVSNHRDLQWFEIFRGYVADAILAAVFLLLGAFALQLSWLSPQNHSYRWLGAALVMTGLVRGNQITYFWFQFESLTAFDVTRNVLLVPLSLGVWAIAWQRLLQIEKPRLLAAGFGVLALLDVAVQSLNVGFASTGGMQHIAALFAVLDRILRLLFLAGFAYLFFRCVADRRRFWVVSIIAIILLSIGLFASELSAIGVPGIWFPYGTGVSRTQYAFAALVFVIPSLFTLYPWSRAKTPRSFAASVPELRNHRVGDRDSQR
jgi:hypothetical protein